MFEKIFSSGQYGLIATIIIAVLILYVIYNKIKFRCLEKVSEFIAEVEKDVNLSGEEKFNLVKKMISSEIKFANNTFCDKLLNKLIQITYNNTKLYAINYIARKVGCSANDVTTALDTLKNNCNNEQQSKT